MLHSETALDQMQVLFHYDKKARFLSMLIATIKNEESGAKNAGLHARYKSLFQECVAWHAYVLIAVSITD